MEVLRRIETVVGHKVVIELPETFEDQRVEVIVLTLDHDVDASKAPSRPHPSLAGTILYGDDLFDSVPPEDWEMEP